MGKTPLIVAATALLALASQNAVPAAHPVVPGFERFYSDAETDRAAGGQLLLGELNCVSCHRAEKVAVKQAPILDEVGSRVRPSYLTKFLTDPQSVKPGTTMPNLFAGDKDREAKVEALVHFLASTGSLRPDQASQKLIAPGRDTYAKIGCIACHGPREADGKAVTNLPNYLVPLGDLEHKYTVASLAAFLQNPLRTRPSGRMPHLLDAKDAGEVANFLLQGLRVSAASGPGSTRYKVYDGAWEQLPDFKKLKASAEGVGPALSVASAERGNNFGIVFTGFINIPDAGRYRFFLSSDDGSRLLIDGKLIVNNDSVHPPTEETGEAELTKGKHEVAVEFFQGGGGMELQLEIQGNGVRQSINSLLAADGAMPEQKPAAKADGAAFIAIKPELVEKGKALFASVGCANCHQMAVAKKPIAPQHPAPALKELKTGGCLAEQPKAGLPFYSLSAAQRAALEGAIAALPAENNEPAAVIARTMITLNCYACHQRTKRGGPTEETNKFFITAQPEMGDEGRVPPSLDGVGSKLNPAYFNQILDKGVHDRPYMLTRMPGFGLANVVHLQESFAKLDTVPATPPVEFDVPMSKVYSTARHLVGGQALACVKCHTFNGVRAEGIQGIDMTIMPKRLNRDWFHYYMLDPQRVRPGTRMPSAFLNNMSLLPNLLDGKALTQIEAIWVYLKLGRDAALPLGMGKKSIPLRPAKEAIIYRNFIQGAGTRAIGVGYPEKVSVAFDANDLRLALIWQGAFIDAARHWEGRGEGFEGPLGDNVLALPPGVPVAILEKPDVSWPKAAAKQQGYQFNGYRLTPDERPTFEYAFKDIKVEDTPSPLVSGDEVGLRRILKLSAPHSVENLYFRAAVGKKIEAAGDGWFKIDGWKMRIRSQTAPLVRKEGDKMELIVPLTIKDGKAQLEQEFAW